MFSRALFQCHLIIAGGLTYGQIKLENFTSKVVWNWKDISLKKCYKYGGVVSLLRKFYSTLNAAELNQLLNVTCNTGISLSRKQSAGQTPFPSHLKKNLFSLSLHCSGSPSLVAEAREAPVSQVERWRPQWRHLQEFPWERKEKRTSQGKLEEQTCSVNSFGRVSNNILGMRQCWEGRKSLQQKTLQLHPEGNVPSLVSS